MVHDRGRRKESYHYSHEGSEFASDFALDGDRSVREVSYRHRGEIAWVGVGLYFGALDCKGHSAFGLAIRSEKPCRLEVKAYRVANEPYTAVFPVGTEWRELLIPFRALKRGERTFRADGKLLKIEFQPNPDHNGNRIFLGPFRLTAALHHD